MSIAIDLLSARGSNQASYAELLELVAFWQARWSVCERFDDAPSGSLALLPASDKLALFETVDDGVDFRAQQIGGNLSAFLGRDWSGTRLSQFPCAFRGRFRRVLLRAALSRAPAIERGDWLIEGSVQSAISCALPVAGGFYWPSKLALGLFRLALARPSLPFPRASPRSSPTRRSASATDL